MGLPKSISSVCFATRNRRGIHDQMRTMVFRAFEIPITIARGKSALTLRQPASDDAIRSDLAGVVCREGHQDMFVSWSPLDLSKACASYVSHPSGTQSRHYKSESAQIPFR